MCLLVVAWNAHPDFRLVIAGNRDEFHERPAAALGWWNDGPPVLAGRDLKGSGTWLGLARDGRFGIVTNFRDFDPPPAGAPTRGELVPSYLRGEVSAGQYLGRTRAQGARLRRFQSAAWRSRLAALLLEPRQRSSAVPARRDLRAFEPVARYALAQAHAHTGALRCAAPRQRDRRRGTLRTARGSNDDRGCGSAAHRPARGLGARGVGTVRRT